jgi:hypothetical protein
MIVMMPDVWSNTLYKSCEIYFREMKSYEINMREIQACEIIMPGE